MNIAKCKKCGTAAEHYAGVVIMCSECWKAKVRANRAANPERYRAYDRERGRTPSRKLQYADKQRRRRSGDSAYMRAHNVVTRAIRAGKLTRPDKCERCPAARRIQAHHDDHRVPFAIMWLCPICHAARHSELAAMRAAV